MSERNKFIIYLFQGFALLILSWSFSMTASADLLLTAPPRESAFAGKAVYQPFADHLTKILGQKVTYEHPRTWVEYKKNMQLKKYDIIFDGPHFAAWRIKQGMAQPLVKLSGNLEFILITKNADSQINSVASLVGEKVCVLPSPNLGTLYLYSMYPNPMQQPKFQFTVVGGPKAVANAFLADKCRGAFLPKYYYLSKLTDKQRSEIRIMAKSKGVTNQGITVSNKITQEARKRIIHSLTQPDGQLAVKAIIKRFANGSGSFKVASLKDYQSYNLLQENMIFGW